MEVQNRRVLIQAALGLLSAFGGVSAATAHPQSGASGRRAVSFDQSAAKSSLSLEAEMASACAALSAEPALDASTRRHLWRVAVAKRKYIARLAPRIGEAPELWRPPPARLSDLVRAQQDAVRAHGRTLRHLRSAEMKAALAPLLVETTYHAGLLHTLQVRSRSLQA